MAQVMQKPEIEKNVREKLDISNSDSLYRALMSKDTQALEALAAKFGEQGKELIEAFRAARATA
jgi:phosphoribosyl-ATP pyrophosphohydrolase